MTFAEWLEQKRIELNITQEEFAKRLGVGISQMSHLLKGRRNPTPAQVQKLLTLFSIEKNSPEYNQVIGLYFESELKPSEYILRKASV